MSRARKEIFSPLNRKYFGLMVPRMVTASPWAEQLQVVPEPGPPHVLEIRLQLLGQDVLDVVLLGVDALRIELELVPAEDLARPHHARPHPEDLALRRRVEADEVGILRARADEAHVARHARSGAGAARRACVQRRTSAHPGHPRIALLGQARAQVVGVVDHGAELEDPEGPAVLADALLAEEHRAPSSRA